MIRLTHRVPEGIDLWVQVIECVALATGMILDVPVTWTVMALFSFDCAERHR